MMDFEQDLVLDRQAGVCAIVKKIGTILAIIRQEFHH
jgi:hypothetical protein